MTVVTAKLTVLFQDPFWIGLYERQDGNLYEVCRIVFGSEPREPELYEFLLHRWKHLSFTPALRADAPPDRRINPKRMQRLIREQTACGGIGTKAQQALKLQQAEGKLRRQALSRAERQAEQERQFQLRQERRKAKHRGR